MVDKRIEDIAEKMSQEGKDIYLAMIPPYKTGYADYVFQTDKPDIQARRIKNLDKNFRRLLTEPYFWIQPMSQDSAEQIAAWTYPAPYDFYDMVADEEDLAQLLSESTRENTYFEVIRNGALFGFATFFPKKDHLEIGLGMKPDQTGQGLGVNFYQAIEDYARKNFDCRVSAIIRRQLQPARLGALPKGGL